MVTREATRAGVDLVGFMSSIARPAQDPRVPGHA
jgi:hypothetical protein